MPAAQTKKYSHTLSMAHITFHTVFTNWMFLGVFFYKQTKKKASTLDATVPITLLFDFKAILFPHCKAAHARILEA